MGASQQKCLKMQEEYELLESDEANMRILRDKATNDTYALVQYCYLKKSEFEAQRQLLEHSIIASDSILRLQKIWAHEQNNICSSTYKIYGFFCYPLNRLDQEIKARVPEQKLFEESELYSILQTCVEAILHEHWFLSPQLIHIAHDGMLKVVHKQLLCLDFAMKFQKGYYYAPEKILHWDQCSLTSEEESSRALFSAGMTVLDCALLRSLHHCYSLTDKSLRLDQIEQYIEHIPYTRPLKLLLRAILLQTARPTLAQVQKDIHYYFLDKPTSPSTIEDNFYNLHLPQTHNHQHSPISATYQHSPTTPVQHSSQNYSTRPTKDNIIQRQGLQHYHDQVIESASHIPKPFVQHPNHILPVTMQNTTFISLCKRKTVPKVVSNPSNQHLPRNPFNFIKSKRSKDQGFTDPKIMEMIQQELSLFESKQFEQRIPSNGFKNISIKDRQWKQNTQYMGKVNLERQEKSNNQYIGKEKKNKNIDERKSGMKQSVGWKDEWKAVQKVWPIDKERHIFVTEEYGDGSRFEGMQLKGVRNGQGKLTYADGAYYEGGFKNGQIDGRGTLFYEVGRPAYVGDWVQDEFHGKGTLYNQVSCVLQGTYDWRDFNAVEDYWLHYQGQFVNDRKCGHGTLLLTNGEKIQGSFVNDQLNGRAVFHSLHNQRIQGLWKNNLYVSN